MTSNDADPFVSELKRWRDVRGLSQSAMAREMGYHRTYLSKIEGAQERPTLDFATRAEGVVRSGGALLRAFHEGAEFRGTATISARSPHSEAAGGIVVEHDHARLVYDGRNYRAIQRREIHNGGSDPITGYLIRISVDRHPGSAEQSNQLYRESPLTWDELSLSALHADRDQMNWRVQHDRDAFKEVWLLFENDHGRFPLYPGESTSIEYSYSVTDDKWGQWFQRAVRLPTRRLSVELDFPSELEPAVWGTETTMAAAALPLRTAIHAAHDGDRSRYSWSTENPPLHGRYRLEWNFRSPQGPQGGANTSSQTPSSTMRALGIAQAGDPILEHAARPFDLPAEAEDARRVVAQLHATMERIAATHTFSKGMGLAAPQIGIGRAAAVVRPPGGDTITLINPRAIEESGPMDEQYEGCLSFFDVRGMVPRKTVIHVEHQDVDGSRRITVFDRGLARLIAHEVDHLQGMLYTARMESGVDPIPVAQYRGTGRPWHY